MTNYKDFEKIYIGYSDGAFLTLVGGSQNSKGVFPEILCFGMDSSYKAYLVFGNDVEIGSHYSLECSFDNWLKIYDDEGLVTTLRAKKIKVYRAKEMGCIIQLTENI